MVQPKFAVSAQ